MRLDGTGRGRHSRCDLPLTIRCRRTSSSWGSTPMRTCTMFLRTCRRFDSTKDTKGSKVTKTQVLFFVLFDLFVPFVLLAAAQSVDPALLLKPTADSWPT